MQFGLYQPERAGVTVFAYGIMTGIADGQAVKVAKPFEEDGLAVEGRLVARAFAADERISGDLQRASGCGDFVADV